MSTKQIDIEAMFKEMDVIFKKYNAPKGIGFVPDSLEIILERNGEENFELTYSEFFSYLPYGILNKSLDNTIKLFHQMGIPIKTTIKLENGIKVQLGGDFRIILFPMIEILLQNKNIESDLNSIYEYINKILKMFSTLLDFHWNYNREIKEKISIYENFIQKNPSIQSEIEYVIKKYA
jgi:hypothetical protein